MTANYICMEEELNPPQLAPAPVHPKFFPYRCIRRFGKPRIEPWFSIMIAIFPFYGADQLLKYFDYMQIYIPIQHLPVCIILLLSFALNPAASTGIVVTSLGVIGCCLVFILGIFATKYQWTHNTCVLGTLTFGSTVVMCIFQIIVLILGWRDSHIERSVIWGYFGTALITVPGLMLIFLSILAVGVTIEFVLRVLTCHLRGCINPLPLFHHDVAEFYPMSFSQTGIVYASCVECVEALKGDDTVVRADCRRQHLFHPACLLRSACYFSERRSCPICGMRGETYFGS